MIAPTILSFSLSFSLMKEPRDVYRALFVESPSLFPFLHARRPIKTGDVIHREEEGAQRARPYQETEVTSRTFIGSVYLPASIAEIRRIL